MQDALEQGTKFVADVDTRGLTVTVQKLLDAFENCRVHNPLMLAWEKLTLVRYAAGVERAGQQSVQVCAVEWLAAAFTAGLGRPSLADPTATGEFADHGQKCLSVQVQLEDGSHLDRFVGVDHELRGLPVQVVAEKRMPACPFAFLAGRGKFVTGAFADDFSFELGET